MSRTVYFIELAYKYAGSAWELDEYITDIHPLKKLSKLRGKFPDTDYQIIFWKEVPFSLEQLRELNLEVGSSEFTTNSEEEN